MEPRRIDLDILFAEAAANSTEFGKMFFGYNTPNGFTIYDGGQLELEICVRYAVRYGTWSSVVVPMCDEMRSFISDGGDDPANYLLIQYFQITERHSLVQTFIAVQTSVFDAIYNTSKQ